MDYNNFTLEQQTPMEADQGLVEEKKKQIDFDINYIPLKQ